MRTILAHASLLCLLSASGCAQWIGIEDLPEITDGSPAPPDAASGSVDASPIDADPGEDPFCGWPFQPRFFDPCSDMVPQGLKPLALDQPGTYTYDTENGSFTNPAGQDIEAPRSTNEAGGVRAIWFEGVEISAGATLRAIGPRPLMIVSTGEIHVRGAIDVSSKVEAPLEGIFSAGAGADPAPSACTSNGAGVGGDCIDGAGGGGGGGFGGDGGTGGLGGFARCEGGDGIAGGAGGSAVPPPSTIRGGCPGQRGGNGDDLMLYGLGGPGGGGVHLVSRVRVEIEGTLHAGGAAGTGAENSRSGGGGAGSGGYIGIEAPMIRIAQSATLAANGGGGGGGCNNGLAQPGQDGLASAEPASGGGGQSSDGGDGGPGGADDSADGEPGEDELRGGGGGGGGAGYVVTYQSEPVIESQAVISPAPTEL